jgi:hypothetical protein
MYMQILRFHSLPRAKLTNLLKSPKAFGVSDLSPIIIPPKPRPPSVLPVLDKSPFPVVGEKRLFTPAEEGLVISD